jgi:hypothetical protein
VTPKQAERLQTKISNIKRSLAAEKRKFGCYDDSRGLRYLPTKYFIQLQDYKGGLTYLRWFSKNFPDDGGFPDFLLNGQSSYSSAARLRKQQKRLLRPFVPTHTCLTNSSADLLRRSTSGKVLTWKCQALQSILTIQVNNRNLPTSVNGWTDSLEQTTSKTAVTSMSTFTSG